MLDLPRDLSGTNAKVLSPSLMLDAEDMILFGKRNPQGKSLNLLQLKILIELAELKSIRTKI